MKDYNRHILLLVKRLLIALFLFFCARVFFLVLNHSHFAYLSFLDAAYVFFVGMRFDLSVIVYFNLPIILMHVLPLGKVKNKKGYQYFIKYYFVIVNSSLILFDLGDARYYDFTLKRSTAYLLYTLLSDDVPILIPRFIVDYWYVPATWIMLVLTAWLLYSMSNLQKKTFPDKAGNKFISLAYQYMVFAIILGLALLGARGGLQNRPLTVVNATKYTSVKSAPLALNTPFTIMTTYGHKYLEEKAYFEFGKSEEIYPIIHQYDYPDSAFRKINVVFLLLESFSREYSGFLNGYKGYTPFLDSLMQHSLLFTNAYATATRSVDAVHTITTGIAPLMDDPLTVSAYNTNKINSIAQLLKEKGYQTGFFHGGNNGTLNFDSFSEMAGFDAYYGRDEYNNDADYDGYWGIYDHAFLQYFAEKLDAFKSPFFALEFTMSSHNPYKVPEEFQDKFPEDDVKMHRVIQYSDYALQQFFKTASAMPWFNNTLFVLLADHTGHSVSMAENMRKSPEYQLKEQQVKYYKSSAGQYAIPILFYFPGDSLKGERHFTFQQSDVLPSVLDYMCYNKPFLAFGNSAFKDSSIRVAYQSAHDVYQITRGDYSLLFDGKKSVSLYNNQLDPQQKTNLISSEKQIATELETLIKAIVQQYNYRMLNNKLTP